jgi:hypothetical protein
MADKMAAETKQNMAFYTPNVPQGSSSIDLHSSLIHWNRRFFNIFCPFIPTIESLVTVTKYCIAKMSPNTSRSHTSIDPETVAGVFESRSQ